MKASIIIPTKDKLSRLRLTLKALEGQITQKVEVIIVFDGCSHETVAAFGNLKFDFPTKNIISKRCVGRAAARNLGLKEAQGDIIIFLDDDRIPAKSFVEKHIAAHAAKGKSVILGRRNEVVLDEGDIDALYHSKDMHTDFEKFIVGTKPYPFYSFKTFFLLGKKNPLRYIIFSTGNVSVDRAIFDVSGIFDEEFKGWGHEDADLGYRLVQHHFRFFMDNSIVNYHLVHITNKENKRAEGIRNLNYFGSKYRHDIILQILVQARKVLLKVGI